jgi:hypothetical protein
VSTDSEVRGSKLAERVEEIEKLIRSGVRVTGTSLTSLLATAQGQLDATRLEVEQLGNAKKEKEQKELGAIAAMVERETKLNEEEKKKYSEFLAKDYFENSDISELSKFYADGGTYDRLSETGKAEMDHRVKEGIKRGEFEAKDLPEVMQKKALDERTDLPGNQKSALEVRQDDQKTGSAENDASAARKDSTLDISAERQDTNDSKQKAKPVVPEGLAGLASLSPVQETDSVSVPQTGKDSSSREIGG